jgi:predicted PurR-regulated permease PerM
LAGTGPVLLLTLVGGLWGFGPRGLILAPAALVLALSAWDALTSLYSDDPQLSEGGQPAVDDV